MIERLQHALAHLDELSPEAQDDLAQQIEELITLPEDLPELHIVPADEHWPSTIRSALAVGGAWSDWQDDDEFTALDHLRHASPPTPPQDAQLAWLDDADPPA